MEPEEDISIKNQLEKLHSDLVLKFEELHSDNKNMKLRLSKIETKLGIEREGEQEKPEVIEGTEEREIENIDNSINNEEETRDLENIVDNSASENEEDFDEEYVDEEEEKEELDDVENQDSLRVKEVKLEKIPKSIYKGFCFRPIAGWKNSQGKFEISKESVEIDEDGVELKISGFESNEEIAKIRIPLRDVEKAEAVFEGKTILFLHVGSDICQAALQSLSMTNISSFSLVDQDTNRIRICFEGLPDERRVLLREYFRRRAIYFKTLGSNSAKGRVFFKPIRQEVPPKYDSNKPQPLDDFVKTIKTLKFLDRVTYRCKVCDYYNQNKTVVVAHVTRFHIDDKKTISDGDIVSKYINHTKS